MAIREILEKNHQANEKLKAEKEEEAKKQSAEKQKKKVSFDTDGKKKKPSILPFLLFGIVFIGAGIGFWIKKPDLFPKPDPDAGPDSHPGPPSDLSSDGKVDPLERGRQHYGGGPCLFFHDGDGPHLRI